MDKRKVIFMGTKKIGYMCFAYLIEQAEVLGIEIVGLYTKQNTTLGSGYDLSELAIKHSISLFFSLDNMPDCDIIYSVQYHQILKKEHIQKAKILAVNLHMAPLPEYRGCNQFSYAIIENKKEFGTTIHQLDESIDSGAIIFEKRFPIPSACWVGELYNITYEHTLSLYTSTLHNICTGTYTLTPQAELITERGTSLHYRKEMDGLKIIDVSWDDEKKQRYIRATSMAGFEMPYSIINNEKVYYTPKETVEKK